MLGVIDLVCYSVASFGLWYIVGYSQISLSARRYWKYKVAERVPIQWRHTPQTRWVAGYLLDLVECPACLGFWTGGAFGAYLFGAVWWAILGAAFYTTASNLLLAAMAGIVLET